MALGVMIDTISRVEAWLAVASHRAASRSQSPEVQNDTAVEEVVNERRQAAESQNVLVNLPLEIVLARQAREYASLTANAAIVDRWSTQLLNPPVQHCSCRHGAGGSGVPEIQTLDTRVVTEMLNSYRTITRTDTGRLIDVVV